MAVSVSAQTRLLVVAPHPDDETLGSGLLIQQVLAAGGAVRILLMTDGDNNPWPQRYLERRIRIDDAARARWGQRRRKEAEQAIQALGVSASALSALGWPDMGLTARLMHDTDRSIAAIASAIDAFQPTLMTCPALKDSHPDHGGAHVLCALALARSGSDAELLAYPVHGHADREAYALVIEGSAEQQQRKLQALSAHRTQMTLSAGRMRGLAQGAEHYTQLVAPSKDSRRLPWQPPAWLHPWLRLLIATPDGVQDWRWPEAPISRDVGGYRVTLPSHAEPAFAKLHLDWPSLWIFDHWGWCAL